MATNQQPIKEPAIFLAQFMGKEAPFDTLENMAKWAASLGYGEYRYLLILACLI